MDETVLKGFWYTALELIKSKITKFEYFKVWISIAYGFKNAEKNLRIKGQMLSQKFCYDNDLLFSQSSLQWIKENIIWQIDDGTAMEWYARVAPNTYWWHKGFPNFFLK